MDKFYKLRKQWIFHPADSMYQIRFLPNPYSKGENPFVKVPVYYNLSKEEQLISPAHFGRPDAVTEYLAVLQEKGVSLKDPVCKELKKRLSPVSIYLAPILVRRLEHLGPRYLCTTETQLKDIKSIRGKDRSWHLGNLQAGMDVVLRYTSQPNGYPLRTFYRTEKLTPASNDLSSLQAALNSLPHPESLYREPSFEEHTEYLFAYLKQLRA